MHFLADLAYEGGNMTDFVAGGSTLRSFNESFRGYI
jgi:hypothetical protein